MKIISIFRQYLQPMTALLLLILLLSPATLHAAITDADLAKVIQFIQAGKTERAKAEITILLDDNPGDAYAPALRKTSQNPVWLVEGQKVQEDLIRLLKEGKNQAAREQLQKLAKDHWELVAGAAGIAPAQYPDASAQYRKLLESQEAFDRNFVAATKEATKLACLNNLREISGELALYNLEHYGKYPFQISTNKSGTRELRQIGSDGYDINSFLHFVAASNYFKTPSSLVCPEDKTKTAASNFQEVQANNVSYQFYTGRHPTLDLDNERPPQVLIRCPVHGNVVLLDESVLTAEEFTARQRNGSKTLHPKSTNSQ